MNKIITGFVFLAIVGMVYFALQFASKESDRLMAMRECIVAMAYAQGYAGDPYSEEAWTTFSPACE